MSTITIVIDNIYEDGDQVTNTYTEDIALPKVEDAADEFEEWAYDNLFPFTGTGREDGDAAYFLKITAFEERPDLVGHEFEWGV